MQTLTHCELVQVCIYHNNVLSYSNPDRESISHSFHALQNIVCPWIYQCAINHICIQWKNGITESSWWVDKYARSQVSVKKIQETRYTIYFFKTKSHNKGMHRYPLLLLYSFIVSSMWFMNNGLYQCYNIILFVVSSI